VVWKIEAAMVPKIVTTEAELVAVVRDRKAEAGITCQTLDGLAGLADGHAAKLLCGTKNFGEMSLGCVLQALAMKLIVVSIVEDPEQRARMEGRWTPRKRPQRKARTE
jgi:hypothetical protein